MSTSSAALRYGAHLRQRYGVILAYTGLICLIVACLLLVPLLLLPFYPAEIPLAWAFLVPGVSLGLAGLILWWLLAPREPISPTLQEGMVIVVLTWLLATLVGAVPFLLAGGLTFTQAVFESTSGWTTTGLSVVDVTQAPYLILFYRSLMQLAGGAGLAIITLSALTGPAGIGVSAAEGRGEQLAPHVRHSATLVLTIYLGYNVAGVVALYLAGMGWFDAINHTFTALSTGGFSTRAESIGYWDNPAIEAVIIVLMLLGTMNFQTGYLLLRRQWQAVWRNGELRLEAFVIPICALIVLFGVVPGLYPSLAKGVRVALFETVTALSTTGFSTVSYLPWNGLGWLTLITLMLIGGGTGSTAGAIKQYRIYVLWRALGWHLRRALLPRQAITELEIWQGERRQFVSERALLEISLFLFLYLLIFFAGTMIIAAYGYTLQESLFEFASAQGTVGLSVGVTAADAPPGVLWVQTAGMILGRLEFFPVILGLGKLRRDIPKLLSG